MKKTGTLLAALVLIGGLVLVAGCIGSASEQTPEGNWVLISIGSGSNAEKPIGTINLDLLNKNASGNSGVNNYFGTVSYDNSGAISFSPMASTRMAGPEDKMKQEHEYLTALSNAVGYKIENGNLILMDADGNVLLTFGKPETLAPGLEGTSWTSSDYEGVTLEFGSEDRFNGKGPVNGFFGGYTVTGDNGVTFGTVGATLMAGPEDKMKQESELFSKFELVAGFKISGDSLTLTDKDGNVLLSFSKAVVSEPEPELETLTNTTWTLVKINGETPYENARDVTMLFNDDGTVGGSAPVNGYGGSWTVSEDQIAITEVISTLMASLDEKTNAYETEFYASLGKVVSYEFVEGNLVLSDENGSALLIFSSE